MSPKSLDLTNLRFGNLIALSRLPERENGYFLWDCVCDCGGKAKVSTRKLQRGTITNCGCIPKTTAHKGSIPEDISGKRFGMLTAIHKETSRGGKTQWFCRCDCGGTRIAATSFLKNGKIWHCGCELRRKDTFYKLNLQGKRFGRLQVIGITEKRTAGGSVIWKCICDCGNEVDVSSDSLIRGGTISCGCRKQEIKDSIHDTLTFVDGTCIEWLRSRKHRRDNTSGFRGVYRFKNKWRAGIGFKGKRYHLGTFDSFEKAKAIRLEAEKKLHEDYVYGWEKWCRLAESDPIWAENNPFYFEVYKNGTEITVRTSILTEGEEYNQCQR